MRALTHPLRLDLLELLAADGPATAAACGRTLGASQASCSFHLRQLAKYGYVEEADQGTDRRERRWRMIESRRPIRFGPERDGVVMRRLERLVVERETQAILAYVDGAGEAGGRREAAGMIAAVAELTPQEAAELKRKWRELLEPYIVPSQSTDAESGADGGGAEPDRERVRVFIAMTPMAHLGDHDADDQKPDNHKGSGR